MLLSWCLYCVPVALEPLPTNAVASQRRGVLFVHIGQMGFAVSVDVLTSDTPKTGAIGGGYVCNAM